MVSAEVYNFDFGNTEEFGDPALLDGRLSDDRFKTIAIPLGANVEGPSLVELSIREFSELPGEDRLLLGVGLGESFSGTEDLHYRSWLTRIYNKGTPPGSATQIDGVLDLATRLKAMDLLENGGSRFRLTETSRSYLQDRFSFDFAPDTVEDGEEKNYEDFTDRQMVIQRSLEYIGDTIVQRSGGEVRGWLAPIDNTATILLSLFHEMNNNVFRSQAVGRKQTEYVNRLLRGLETKHGMIEVRKISIDGRKNSCAPSVNVRLRERGIVWYEDHVAKQVEIGKAEATEEDRQRTAATDLLH